VDPAPPPGDEPLTTADKLVALLERDAVPEIEEELRRAGAVLGPKRFVTDVAQPFAVSVGDAWAEGRISVRHEHVATECLTTRLRALLSTFQDLDGRPVVLLATLPGEPHGLGLQMVALYLVASGAKPRLLGVSTPTDDILDAARVHEADAVGLTLTPVVDAREATRQIRLLRRRLDATVALWLGGPSAMSVGPFEGDVRTTTTWAALDEALAHWRRPRS
jgi:methanogenic corrinoid protein MtbC1